MGLWDVDKIEYVGRAKGPKEDFAFHYYDADKAQIVWASQERQLSQENET